MIEEINIRVAKCKFALWQLRRQPRKPVSERALWSALWTSTAEVRQSLLRQYRLVPVHAQLGHKKDPGVLFQGGFRVLAEVTQTRDEDIRQALQEAHQPCHAHAGQARDGNRDTIT